jgi:L-alanine-DL-glutamate epimerase-like enolase superfamily enzyme
MSKTRLRASIETFPVAGRFTIARGSRTEIAVVRVELERDGIVGQGECVPYARYGETPADTLASILALEEELASGLDRTALQSALPAGAARNGIDCALWDLEARTTGIPVANLAGLVPHQHIETAYTISLGTPETMAEATTRATNMPLLKVKLGADGDAERLAAVREAAPSARIIVDANEGWAGDVLEHMLALCARHRVELVEQPLPSDADGVLAHIARPVPVCADESTHTTDGLVDLVARYDAVNIKLDKTGGLTEALRMAQRAEELGLSIMVGCMLSTSLSMAPAALLAGRARWVDLDGPLLLSQDRPGGLTYDKGIILGSSCRLWGG